MFQEPRADGKSKPLQRAMAALGKRFRQVGGPLRAGFCRSDSPEAAIGTEFNMLILQGLADR